jgi:hypothetical protein
MYGIVDTLARLDAEVRKIENSYGTVWVAAQDEDAVYAMAQACKALEYFLVTWSPGELEEARESGRVVNRYNS